MNDNPLLPRLERRSIKPPQEDRELWQPQWRCFCCHDTGIVRSHLVQEIIPDFDSFRDLIPLCQNQDCKAGDWMWSAPSLKDATDNRFNQAICQRLDLIERDAWKQTLDYQREIAMKTYELAQSKSLRSRDRTVEEIELAQAQHKEISAL